MSQTIQIAGVVKQSIVDGPGLRFTVFVQGCPHHCIGCHNESTWDFQGGFSVTPEKIITEMKKNPLLQGITLSGGEPMEQAESLIPLAKAVKKMGKDVFCYTGYAFEKLLNHTSHPFPLELLHWCDWLVDGPFVKEQRDLSLCFRGSKNQRILNIPQSLRQKTVVLDEEFMQRGQTSD